MSNAASEAAAGMALDVATELIAKSAPSEVAPSLVEDIHAAAAEPSAPSSQPVVASEEDAEDEEVSFELPTFSYIEADEDEEEDDEIPAAVVDEDLDEDEYEDPDALRARLAQAEKKAKHYEAQAAQVKRDQWRVRFKNLYPLANVDEITATSRRSFEKAAIKSHNANFKLLEPHLNKLQEAAAQLTTSVTAEARTNAAAAFGKPVAGPGIVPLEASAQTEDLVAARKTGDLRKVLSVLMRQ